MDSDKLVEEIVRRVLDRVEARPRLGDGPGRGDGSGRGDAPGRGTGLGPGRQPGEPRISVSEGAPTGLVRPYLLGGRDGAQSAPRTASRRLVVLTAGDGRLEEVYRQVGLLDGGAGRVRVYLSPSARKVLDLAALRRAAPGAELLPEQVTYELRQVVEEAEAVYLPNLTLSTASKIAHLDGDSAASLMAIYALARGKPVLACTESMYGVRPDMAGVPAGFRARVEAILSDMQALGVRIVALEALASEPPSSGAAGANPGVRPSATSRTGTASVARPRAGTVTGPCNGDPDKCEACGACAEKNEPAVRALVANGADRVGASLGTRVTDRNVARLIDHTLLKPDATEEDIRRLCEEARRYGFASVCVNPSYVPLAARLLEGSEVAVCTVIGFPLGATTPTTKAIETRDAIANGATEIDMVINVGALKSGNDDLVRRDIQAVVDAARGKALVKVILETALLSREEKIKACLLAKMAGADFVKTSTGFGPGGATVEDVALMREVVGPEMGVKASGGIRDLETAKAMVAAGATRIGASASVAIVRGESAGKGGY